ncbi:MAG: hypothetical protein CL878_05355 [Dehalococcoidia bacterium]|nr:hypothetical protein [Dehalococcoidia bacterium]
MGSKWAIGIRGHVVTARTDLELVPGTRLRAHVHSDGAGFVLRLGERPTDALATALARQGVAGDESSKLIARSLMAVGLPVRAETVALLRRIMTSWAPRPPLGRLTPSRLARSLAVLLARGVDLTSPGVRLLVEQLNYDGGQDHANEDAGRRSSQQDSRRDGGEERRRRGERPPQPPQSSQPPPEAQGAAAPPPPPEPPEAAQPRVLGTRRRSPTGRGAAASVASIAEGLRRHVADRRHHNDHDRNHDLRRPVAPLAVFNHLPDQAQGGERWCVVPVAVRDQQGATAAAGTLRLCLRGAAVVRAHLDAATVGLGAAEVRATFVLPGARSGGQSGGPLRVLAEDAGSASALAAALPELADKVRNLGFEVDDIVEEDPAYDGFSTGPAAAGYQQVDTLR